MACINATASTVTELLHNVVGFLVDANNFSSGNQWQLVSPSVISSDTREVILKGVGDGHDEIYIGLKVKQNESYADQEDIILNGYAGYDPGLKWEEQPGAIPHDKLPTIPLAKDILMTYWISANTSRIILIVEMSTQYEGAYLGFMKPAAIERQYPYPLIIGGSYIQDGHWSSFTPGHSLFINPGSDVYGGLGDYKTSSSDSPNENTSSLRIRRPDGSWRTGLNRNKDNKAMKFEKLCVWPLNVEPVKTLTVYKEKGQESIMEDNMLFPCMLYESFPVGLIGELDGVYWLGNCTDLAAKDSILYKDKILKVFSNVFRRDNDQYFAIEWS